MLGGELRKRVAMLEAAVGGFKTHVELCDVRGQQTDRALGRIEKGLDDLRSAISGITKSDRETERERMAADMVVERDRATSGVSTYRWVIGILISMVVLSTGAWAGVVWYVATHPTLPK